MQKSLHQTHMKILKVIPFIAVVYLVYAIVTNGFGILTQTYVNTDYNTFMEVVQNSEVSEITISHSKINAVVKSDDNQDIVYQIDNPHSDTLVSPIKTLNVPITYDYSAFIVLGVFGVLFIALLLIKIFEKSLTKREKLFNTINNAPVSNEPVARPYNNRRTYINRNTNYSTGAQRSQRSSFETNSAQSMTSLANKKIAGDQVKTKFADVAGVDEAKVEVQEIVDFLKNPQKFISFGIRVPRGLILYGQPGTGKTLLAKAIAGEANVPFFSLSGSDFAEMYVGVGAARVRNLFQEARGNKPCIIFIDEIDALARKRGVSHNSNEEKDQTLNQLLVEMDGFQNNDGIVVIGATNRLDILDPAVLRPGRFDRHVEVPVPDKNGRIAILKIHAKNKKIAKDVNFADVANKTTGFSGAELENVLNEAAVLALRKHQNEVTKQDIDEAISKVMVGLKKNKNNLSKKEKKIVAYHEAGHAIATKFLAKKVVEKITILPTNNSLGYVMRGDEDEHFLYSKEELFNSICIALAGRANEKLYFSDANVTNGASNDFQKATSIAKEMVFSYGMSSLGNISLSESFKDGVSVSDSMKDKAYEEVQKILNDAEDKVTKFLKNNHDKVEKLVKALMEKETLYKEEVDKILS